MQEPGGPVTILEVDEHLSKRHRDVGDGQLVPGREDLQGGGALAVVAGSDTRRGQLRPGRGPAGDRLFRNESVPHEQLPRGHRDAEGAPAQAPRGPTAM